MESLLFLLKGILIGLLFGVPVGAVGAMTVSRTLNHGFGAGMVTGTRFLRCRLHLRRGRSIWAEACFGLFAEI